MDKQLKQLVKSNGYAKWLKHPASATQVVVYKSTEQSNLNADHSVV